MIDSSFDTGNKLFSTTPPPMMSMPMPRLRARKVSRQPKIWYRRQGNKRPHRGIVARSKG